MRRLPVYILIDTSGSMRGEPIESVNVGLASMLSYLRQNPYTLENTAVSIITFDTDVKTVLPLTMVSDLNGLPTITTPDSGPTHTGHALEELCRKVDTEVVRSKPGQKGDWRPLLFLITDGHPSDVMLYNEMIPEVKRRNFGSIVACAAGMKAKTEPLRKLTDQVYMLDSMDSTAFSKLFQFISDVIPEGARSVGAAGSLTLPPPPPEVNIVV